MVSVWGHSERLKLTNGNNNQEIIYQTIELLFYFKNKIQETKLNNYQNTHFLNRPPVPVSQTFHIAKHLFILMYMFLNIN